MLWRVYCQHTSNFHNIDNIHISFSLISRNTYYHLHMYNGLLGVMIIAYPLTDNNDVPVLEIDQNILIRKF